MEIRTHKVASVILVVAGVFLLTRSASAQNMSLEGPPFSSSKVATAQADGFPIDDAGLSAYTKVTQTIDMEKIKSVFSRVEGVGDNYIFGIITISNFGSPTTVRLYVDTDGWLVAYIRSDEPAAKIMQWLPASASDPQISTIHRNTLTDALERAKNTAGIGFLPEIKYYDFKFPDANRLTLFIKVVKKEQHEAESKSALKQVQIPSSYTLYEASYYQYAYFGTEYKGNSSELRVDGTRVSNIQSYERNRPWEVALDSYRGAISTGNLHTIQVSCQTVYASAKNSSAGVATVLIYKGE